MSEDYVSRDEFNARMDEMKALIATSEARHKELTAEMRGDMKEYKAKYDGLEDMGIAAALAGIILAAVTALR